MVLASKAIGTAASMMLENTMPVRKSTLSSLTYFSASWRPTSGLNWSSPTSTSAGSPPSLPPFSLTASWKASRMSTPSAALGPDSVLTKPILTLLAAPAPPDSASATARMASRFFIGSSPWAKILKRIEIAEHLRAHRRVGQRARAGGEVVAHVLGVAGAGNRAGDRRMGDDPFQEVLRPAANADLRRPGRQRLSLHLAEE